MVSRLLDQKPGVCAALMEAVKEYFQDEEHEREFQKWYEEKYAKGKQQNERSAV